MSLDALRADIERALRKRGVREHGDEWTFPCVNPAAHAHGDATPSARYNATKGAWCCPVCNRRGGLVDLARHLGVALNGNNKRDGLGRIVATYDYTDEHGALLFQAVRFEPKAFRQRRPAADGSGWAWRLGDVRRVLFRLPRLLAVDPLAPVFVVEGEKDVLALEALGLVATTNVGGAGKWRQEYSDTLRDRHVIVLPDNDAPGREHARQVATTLADVAASVRIVNLHNLPEKGDVSDWLAAGGTVEQLHTLVAATTPLDGAPDDAPADESEQEAEAEPRFRLLSMDQVLNLPPPEWLVSSLLERDAVSCLYGPPGGGKSFVALDLALHIALGRPWHGRDVQRGHVVYVAAESSRGIGIRCRAWCDWHVTRDVPGFSLVAGAPNLYRDDVDMKALMAAIRVRLGDETPALIVLDTLARVAVGAEENSAKELGIVIARCEEIRRAFPGACILLVHHTTKDGAAERGSVALRAAMQTMVRCDLQDQRLVLTPDRQKDAGTDAPYALDLRGVELDGVEHGSCVVVEAAGESATLGTHELVALDILRNRFGGEASRTEWQAAFEADTSKSRATFDRALNGLHRRRLVKKDGRKWALVTPTENLS